MAIDTIIKPGYKQTELGLIPNDWSVKKMNFIADVRDGTHDSPKYVEQGVKFVTSKNIINGKLDFSEISYISENDAYKVNQRSKVDRGDILMSMIGTIGNAVLIDFKPDFCIKNVALIKPFKQKINANFLIQLISSSTYQEYLIQKLDGGIQKFISLGTLRDLDVFIPSEEIEQTAIASVLSDTDALIENLEKLIDKKKAIKQGTIQQLLTGKKRLPGFGGEWKLNNLKSMCWYQEGPGVRNYQFTSSGVKLLNGTNISKGKVVLDTTNRYISKKEAFGWYRHFLVDVGDILIASSGVTIDKFQDKVAFASSNNLPLCMNTSTVRFKVNPELLDKFLYFFLQSDSFKGQIGKQATGSAQLNFGPSHLNKINIDVPPTKDEQIEITKILSDMENEIEGLEKEKDKYVLIKQGMMQQLLTGKIRLYAN